MSPEQENEVTEALVRLFQRFEIGPTEAVPILARAIILACTMVTLETHGDSNELKKSLKVARDIIGWDEKVQAMFAKAQKDYNRYSSQ